MAIIIERKGAQPTPGRTAPDSCFAIRIPAQLALPPLPQGQFSWGTCFAHWGDVLAASSFAQWTMAQVGQQQCGMIYVGPDRHMAEFLIEQEWCREVVAINPPRYWDCYRDACHLCHEPGHWMQYLREGVPGQPVAELPPSTEVWPTHYVPRFGHTLQITPSPKMRLPTHRVEWATDLLKAYRDGRKLVLLHPASVWSAGAGEHWPHWRAAVAWLLDQTDHTYLLTGLTPWDGNSHPRLVNLIDQLPSCMELLALSEMCDGVVSTCNCVSLWNAMRKTPALILGNSAIAQADNFFRRWMARAPNVFLPVEATMDQFIQEATHWANL